MSYSYTDEHRIAHHRRLKEKEVVLESPLPCSNVVGGNKVYLHVDRDLPLNPKQTKITRFIGE